MLSLSAKTIDDLLYGVLNNLINEGKEIDPTKGKNKEIFGASLTLENPRARLSQTESRGKAFSTIGELLWYLSGSNKLDFINYYLPNYKRYSDDGKTIHGAYGPRLFNMGGSNNQIKNVIDLLKLKSNSRRAAIQLFDASDLEANYKDIPCTCTIQLAIRENTLKMVVFMRSNDAYIGLPHDIFCFTMIQEIIARELNVEPGLYHHFVGSLHLYAISEEKAIKYLEEGFQSLRVEMPKMPLGDQWEQIKIVESLEKSLREKSIINTNDYNKLSDYWRDIVLLLQIHSKFNTEDYESVSALKKELKYKGYAQFVEDKLRRINLKNEC